MNSKMAEATRLTKAGRLGEALNLIREATGLAPEPTGSVPPSPAPDAVIDLAPPRVGSAAWTMPDTTGKPAKTRAFRPQPPKRAKPAPDGRFTTHAYTSPQGQRSYKLYQPQGHEGPLPLVVMLHGCTQNPDDFAAGTRMNALADEIGFVTVWPEQPQAANMQRCWNWFNTSDQQRGQGEPALIAGITRQVIEAGDIDEKRVYIAGLSAGGAAAAILGATYPDLYAGIGVHSGLACGAASSVTSAFTAMRQGGDGTGSHSVPTIVFHGDRDTTVSPVNGKQVLLQFVPDAPLNSRTEQGTSPGGVAFTRTVQANAEGRPLAEHWVLHGAGHAWSGGSPAGSYTAPLGPDASREMVRFFLEHSR